MNKVIVYDQQRYECVAIEPYHRRDGQVTSLEIWTSECVQCGEPFAFKRSPASQKFMPNRRCPKHKRSGTKVRHKKLEALPTPPRVFHVKFGLGSVIETNGNQLTIEFERAGRKIVLASFVEPVTSKAAE
jgi:hypothetical protein